MDRLTDEEIHPPGLLARDGSWWFACKEPERPYDGDVVYAGDCVRCLIKAQADLPIRQALVGDKLGVTSDRHGIPVSEMPMVDWINDKLAELEATE